MRNGIEVGREFLYLTKQDVVDLELSDRDVLELTRVGLTEHGLKQVEMPAKIGLHPLADTLIHAMPAHVPAAHACGIKWSSSFPDNPNRGLPQTTGLLILNDEDTGHPIAVMDSAWITARRTPAVSALACEKLARADSRVLTIIGCGVQGSAHFDMLPLALPGLEEIRVLDTRPALAEALAESAPEAPYTVRVASSVEDAVTGADVIATATAILAKPSPFIRHAWVKPNALVLPVDFDSVWEWETFAAADKFVVDSIEEMEYFRSVGYLPNGLPPIHAEIGELVAGVKPGRQSDDELIVDMNIGMAVEDVVVAIELFERALARGVGQRLPT